MVLEAYRQNFRNCKKENDQTHVEFARTKQLFDRWCSSKKIGFDHEKLWQHACRGVQKVHKFRH